MTAPRPSTPPAPPHQRDVPYWLRKPSAAEQAHEETLRVLLGRAQEQRE